MPLKQLTVTNAKPIEKPYKLSDGNGLHLLVKPNGSKLWRLKYRFSGKEKLLSIGAFPEVSIIEAREKATDARKLLATECFARGGEYLLCPLYRLGARRGRDGFRRGGLATRRGLAVRDYRRAEHYHLDGRKQAAGKRHRQSSLQISR